MPGNAFQNYFEIGDKLRTRTREDQVRNALAAAYQEGTPATPAVPPTYVNAGAGQSEPAMGDPGAPARPATPGAMNWESALGNLYKAGAGPEALGVEDKVYGPARDRAKLVLEYNLKRALEEARWDDAVKIHKQLTGGGGMDKSTTFKMTPQGPQIEFDPAKGAGVAREDAKAGFEFGYTPVPTNGTMGAPSGTPAAGVMGAPPTAPAAPGSTINTPLGLTPKAAYELRAKRAEQAPEDLNKLTGAVYDLQRLQENSEFLSKHPGLNSATGWMAPLGSIPAPTDAYGFSSGMDTLKNKIVLNVMSSLKALTASGATGFGNLTEKEGARMENSIDTLNRAQKPEDVKAALLNINTVSGEIQKRLQDAYKNVYGVAPNIKHYSDGFRSGTAPAAPPKVGELRGGYVYLGGKPSDQKSWKKQ